jgi:hypothetical protein
MANCEELSPRKQAYEAGFWLLSVYSKNQPVVLLVLL